MKCFPLTKPVFVFAVLCACLSTHTHAVDDADVIKCEPGYVIWGEPVRAGETVVFTKGVAWHVIRKSDVRLEIDPETLKVTGRMEFAYTDHLVHNEKEKRTEHETIYALEGTIHRDGVTQPQITGRNLIQGNLITIRKDGADIPPAQVEKKPFKGIVSLKSGITIPKFPNLGDSYILLYPPNQGPMGNSDTDMSNWLARNVKDNLNYTFGYAAVKFEVESDMPTWFVDASAERYDPKALIEDQFDEITYLELIGSIDDEINHVKGAATDGATRVWTMVRTPDKGKATFSLDRARHDGGFSKPDAFDRVESSVTVDTYYDQGTKKHYAFALYAPPDVYLPPDENAAKSHRNVDIDIKWQPDVGADNQLRPVGLITPFTLVRPPVILQHGTYDNADYCWRQFPQEGVKPEQYPPGHNAMFSVLTKAGFVLPDGSPAVFTVNFEEAFTDVSQQRKYTSSGLSEFEEPVEVNDVEVGSSSFVNLAHVSWENPGGIRDALKAYRDRGYAATQADFVCHSLGGLVARLYIRGAHLFDRSPQQPHEFPDPDKPIDKTVWYYRPENFMKGDIRRLITIATTHKGSDAPGMLIPYQLLSQGYKLDGSVEDPDSLSARFWRAVDFLTPGTIGPVDRKSVQVLLHFVNKDTGMGGAFHDQQPNSAALNAIGPTPVPAHAIACVSQDADLNTFGGFYWQRMMKIFALSPDPVVRDALKEREHGIASFNALIQTVSREEKARQIMEQAMYTGNIYRPAGVPPVDTLAPVRMFRSVIFGNQPNDCTVRLESALCGLTPGVDGTVVNNVLHGYATTYPAVQKSVVKLLQGGMANFNLNGFPPAGGPTKDLPPPPVGAPPVRPKIVLGVKKVTGKATLADLERRRIEALDTARHLASDHLIACDGGQVDMQLGFDELDDAIVEAQLDAQNDPALVLISSAAGDRNRLEARLLEGSMRISKSKQINCLTRTYTPAAVIEDLDTDFTVTHDYKTQTTTVVVHEGKARIHPLDGSPAYEVTQQQKATLKKPADPIMPDLDDGDTGGGRLADTGNQSGDTGGGVMTDTGDTSTDGDGVTTTDATGGSTSTGQNTSTNTSATSVDGTDDKRPTIDPPKGPMDREIIVMGDGSIVDVTNGTTTPPDGDSAAKRHVLTIPRDALPPSIRNKLPNGVTSVKIPVKNPTDTTVAMPDTPPTTPDKPTIAPPKGPFDRHIIQAARDQPWAEQPTDGPLRNLRNLVFHQIVHNDADRFDKNVNHYNTPTISASGNRIIFAGKKVWVVDYDGGNLRNVGEVDGSVTSRMDISPDGQWVTFADTKHVYAARADGSGSRQLLESTYGAFYGLRVRDNPATVFLMCTRPAKARVDDNAPWEPFGNGIWAIDPSTAARRHVVNFAAMAEQFGYENYTFLSSGYNGGWVMDVSEDGKRIVFALQDKKLKTTRIFGAGDGGVREIARVKESKYNATQSVAISGDGSTVAYVTSGENGALFVVNFDGSNHRKLLGPDDTIAPFTHHGSPTQLTYDGSMWFHGVDNLLVRVSDGLPRSIGYKWYSDVADRYFENHYFMTMNRDAKRFMFRLKQKDGRLGIATMTANPLDRGKAPAIVDVQLDPPRLHATEPATLTAKVDADIDITHARMDVFRHGHFDQNVYYKDLRDDGKGGDQTAGDGVYTGVNIKAKSNRENWTGTRAIRITAEGLDANGMRHGTSADVGPWPVAE